MTEFHVDAKNKILGRLASDISLMLQGKKSPSYDPKNVGDVKVFVKNFADVKVTGKKEVQKIYYRHTGYVGHLKELKYEEVMAKDPKKVLREAVRKMLPKNFLNARRLKNLVFVENKEN